MRCMSLKNKSALYRIKETENVFYISLKTTLSFIVSHVLLYHKSEFIDWAQNNNNNIDNNNNPNNSIIKTG